MVTRTNFRISIGLMATDMENGKLGGWPYQVAVVGGEDYLMLWGSIGKDGIFTSLRFDDLPCRLENE